MNEKRIIFSEPVLYDIFNSNCTDDIGMYLEMCKNNGSVLELGIGTGRVAIPLAKAGIPVFGIDNSRETLSFLERKINENGLRNIIVTNQDMRNLNLNLKFKIIICPFCTFNFLLKVNDQERSIDAIVRHMYRDSIIIFDLLTINTFKDAFCCNELEYYDTYFGSEQTSRIDIYIKNEFDQSNQIITQERIFRWNNPNDVVEECRTNMKNRFFFLCEFQFLLEKYGLRIFKIYGDYNFSPYRRESKSLVVMACLN